MAKLYNKYVKVVGGPNPLDTKVYIVQSDGEELDISDCVTFVEFSCHAREEGASVSMGVFPITEGKLGVIIGEFEVKGEFKRVTIEEPCEPTSSVAA